MAQALEVKSTDEEGVTPMDDTTKLKRVILDTMYFYAEEKEQELSNSPHALPQFPLFVGNSVRSITFWAKFNKMLLPNKKHQCLISIGNAANSQDFNIVRYSDRIGVMGYNYDHYPNNGEVNHNVTEWNHYGIVYDGKMLSIYINGEMDTQIDRNYKTASTLNQSNFIGKSNHNGHNGYPFYGKLKQLKFYGKNLSQQEVKLLML